MLHALSSLLHKSPPVIHPDTYAVPVNKTDPAFGPKKAKVTLIEVFEFLCPYSFAGSSLVQRLLAEFPNDVRFVAKYRVVHGHRALPPAVAFFAASKQGKAREMHDGLWKLYWPEPDDEEEVPDSVVFKRILHLAESLHLNMADFTADLQSHEGLDWIERSQDEMTNFGVFSVPNFFINGRYTPRVRYEDFRNLVKEEIAAPPRHYEDIVKHGQKSGKLELRLF